MLLEKGNHVNQNKHKASNEDDIKIDSGNNGKHIKRNRLSIVTDVNPWRNCDWGTKENTDSVVIPHTRGGGKAIQKSPTTFDDSFRAYPFPPSSVLVINPLEKSAM